MLVNEAIAEECKKLKYNNLFGLFLYWAKISNFDFEKSEITININPVELRIIIENQKINYSRVIDLAVKRAFNKKFKIKYES